MRGSRLTDLDLKFEEPYSVRRRRSLRRRFTLLLVTGAGLVGLVALIAQAQPPNLLGADEPATDTTETADSSDTANSGMETAKTAAPESASDAADWRPGILLDALLPLPNHHDIATGELLLMQRIIALAPDPEPDYDKVTVRSGDSLAAIFARAGLSPQETHRVTNADDKVKALQRIYPGDELYFRLTEDNKLHSLRYALDNVRTLVVERQPDDSFRTRIHEEVLETRVVHATGTIDRSLFISGRRAGLSQRHIMQFMSIFEWQLDFNRDIRQGDTFSVVYEAEFLDGEQVAGGRILAAKLVNRGRRFNALRFEQEDGTVGYYAPDGTNLRKAFMRRPIQNARISSGFDRNRMHPILGERRPHLGTDFAAPTGTPIMASGAGRVVHRSRKGGYGHTVIIEHNNRYRTLYAHMSRYADGLAVGSRVEQGEVIGYVGRSGLATGPHLHYEFMVEGNHFDPMSVDLPTGAPIPDEYMAEFRTRTASLLAQIQEGTRTELAARDED